MVASRSGNLACSDRHPVTFDPISSIPNQVRPAAKEQSMSTSTDQTNKPKREPLRFAHPFFTPTPPDRRPTTPFGRRMTDHVQENLLPIPKPKRPPVMTLADIVGAQSAAAIEKTGTFRFHATGDT